MYAELTLVGAILAATVLYVFLRSGPRCSCGTKMKRSKVNVGFIMKGGKKKEVAVGTRYCPNCGDAVVTRRVHLRKPGIIIPSGTRFHG
jgi:hypothetical protein